MDSNKAEALSKLPPLARIRIFLKSKYVVVLSIAAVASFFFGLSTSLEQRALISESRQYQAQERLARADTMIIKVERQLRENQDKIIDVGEYLLSLREELKLGDTPGKEKEIAAVEKQYNNLLAVSKSSADMENYLRYYREILMFRSFSFNLMATSANAAEVRNPSPPSGMSIEQIKPYILITMFSITSITLILSVLTLCFAKDPDKIKASDGMVKTIIGFYIGISTGMLGLPTS